MYDKRQKETLRGKTILRLFVSLIMLIICALLAVEVADWFYLIQREYIGINNSLLIIHNSYCTGVIIGGILTLGLLICFRIFGGKYLFDTKISYFIIAIVTFLVTSAILAFSFFDYSVIKDNGVLRNKGWLVEHKIYPWSSIEQASVEYYYGYKGRIGVKYVLYMNNGETLDLTNSDEFWKKIFALEITFKHKGLKIIRMQVDADAYQKLKNEFSRPSRAGHENQFQEVILKLFDIKEQHNLPAPTATPASTPSPPDPVHENLEDTNTFESEQSFIHYELRPVDQANEDGSLIEFRKNLISNIEERNINFLKQYFDEQGKWDFGGTTKEQLLESWGEENWLDLQKAVALGGTFFDKEKTVFIAPYTAELFPDEFDEYEDMYDFEVATKDHVEVYMHKDLDSNVIEILNYTVVKRIDKDDVEDSYWKKIEISDGRIGYVIGDNIRSPIDHRVILEKVNNEWKITAFLAGD